MNKTDIIGCHVSMIHGSEGRGIKGRRKSLLLYFSIIKSLQSTFLFKKVQHKNHFLILCKNFNLKFLVHISGKEEFKMCLMICTFYSLNVRSDKISP